MADNIAVTPGTGATIAADDISGVLYPRSKVAWGADGAAVDASAANPLPVVVTTVSTLSAITAGSNLIADVGIQYRASATGAATMARVAAAASTNSTNVKASAGRVVGYHFTNNTAAAKYIKLYNKASAPTVGTDTPVTTLILPASSQIFAQFVGGLSFATGIGYGITGAVADNDTTAVAANDVHGFIAYA